MVGPEDRSTGGADAHGTAAAAADDEATDAIAVDSEHARPETGVLAPVVPVMDPMATCVEGPAELDAGATTVGTLLDSWGRSKSGYEGADLYACAVAVAVAMTP